MKVTMLASIFCLGGCAATPTLFTEGGADTPAEAGMLYRVAFDDHPAGAEPPGFFNVLGTWIVDADPTAPSPPNVLRQKDEWSTPDFPRLVQLDRTFKDSTVRVRCKMESGDTDQACGLMFRLVDSYNYYITRANALESNIRFYRVVQNERETLATKVMQVTANVWHTLEATARGTSIIIRWDGEVVLEASDATFERGNVGLWTKADAITAFDDFEAIEEQTE